jgi:hypothetical protein
MRQRITVLLEKEVSVGASSSAGVQRGLRGWGAGALA